jgi:hypothetical protein
VLSSRERFCEGVLFNLCESFIHLRQKKLQSLLFSFVLYVFLGKLFVKVFQSASQFIWDVKTMFFYAFFYY